MTTFEQVNAHVNEVHPEIAAITAAGQTAPTPHSQTSLCKVWFAAAPILKLLAAFPLIPGKWRDILNALFAGLDSYCAVTPQ